MEIKIEETIATMIMDAFQQWLDMQTKAIDIQTKILDRISESFCKLSDVAILSMEADMKHTAAVRAADLAKPEHPL